MLDVSPRSTTNIDADWRFCLAEPAGAHTPEYDDSKWRVLDLPHDWSIEGEFGMLNAMLRRASC